MNFENLNIWCWIIPSCVGIISGVLGYFLGKGGSITLDHSAELEVLKSKNRKLQHDLANCTAKLISKPTAPTAPPAVASLSFNAKLAGMAMGRKIKQDDLKIVEGIGPKIEQLFSNNGIKTWKDLSQITVARCQEVLASGGEAYKLHDPASWPMQAKMCYEGKWKELAHWQKDHKHGKF